MIAFARGLQCTLPSITSTRTRLSNYSHPLSRDLRVLRRCTRSRYSRGLCKLGGATELLSTAECIRTSRTNSTTHSRTLSLLARHSDTMSMQSRGMSVFAVCTRCCNRRAAHISDHRNHARDIDQLPICTRATYFRRFCVLARHSNTAKNNTSLAATCIRRQTAHSDPTPDRCNAHTAKYMVMQQSRRIQNAHSSQRFDRIVVDSSC